MKRITLQTLAFLVLMATFSPEIKPAEPVKIRDQRADYFSPPEIELRKQRAEKKIEMAEKKLSQERIFKMKEAGEKASAVELVSHDPKRKAALERPDEIKNLKKSAKSLEERNRVHTDRLKIERLKQISDELARRIQAEQEALILANQDMSSALDPANRDTRIAGTKHALVQKHRAKYTELKERAPSLGYSPSEQSFIKLYDQIQYSLTPAGLARDASLDAARIAAEKTRAAAAYVSSYWAPSAAQPAAGSSSPTTPIATNPEPAKSSWFSGWGR